MYIKTFKYPTDNSMISFKKDYDSANSDFNSYQLKVFQEILVNRYIDVVKSKFGISSNDIDLNVTSTVEDNKSYLLYSLVFKTLTHSQIATLTPTDFLLSTTPSTPDTPDTPVTPDNPDIPSEDQLHISGTVYYVNNNTLQGLEEASIILHDDDGGTYTTLSDANGSYDFYVSSSFVSGYVTVNATGFEFKTTNLDGSRYGCSSSNPVVPNIILTPVCYDPIGADSVRIIMGGYVIDESSYEPIPGATVSLLNMTLIGETPSVAASTTTDISGFFSFNETQVRLGGNYISNTTNYSGSISISLVGYEEIVSKSYNLNGGEYWWTPDADGPISLREDVQA